MCISAFRLFSTANRLFSSGAIPDALKFGRRRFNSPKIVEEWLDAKEAEKIAAAAARAARKAAKVAGPSGPTTSP